MTRRLMPVGSSEVPRTMGEAIAVPVTPHSTRRETIVFIGVLSLSQYCAPTVLQDPCQPRNISLLLHERPRRGCHCKQARQCFAGLWQIPGAGRRHRCIRRRWIAAHQLHESAGPSALVTAGRDLGPQGGMDQGELRTGVDGPQPELDPGDVVGLPLVRLPTVGPAPAEDDM